MEQYIDKAAVVAEIEARYNECLKRAKITDSNYWNAKADAYRDMLVVLDTLEVKEINEKSETIYRSKTIKVKCISPFDETWEKGKVYICEKWHHGDLNMDFWDVYYDYDNNPKYVQFSSIEMLEKEFAILRNDTLEVKEVVECKQPEYSYFKTTYQNGKKPHWNIGDTLAYYEFYTDREGEHVLGKVTKVDFDKEQCDWFYTLEDGSVYDEQSLLENETYKKN